MGACEFFNFIVPPERLCHSLRLSYGSFESNEEEEEEVLDEHLLDAEALGQALGKRQLDAETLLDEHLLDSKALGQALGLDPRALAPLFLKRGVWRPERCSWIWEATRAIG